MPKNVLDNASDMMKDICQREGILPGQVTLHSDNGSPMRGATLLFTLEALGIATSLSRPSVSNDNPYSESTFRTLKYRPDYPVKPFDDLQEARCRVEQIVHWYNQEHRHSGIGFVTPAQGHAGLDHAILAQRKAVYTNARAANPARWSGHTRKWEYVEEVHLNPQKSDEKKGILNPEKRRRFLFIVRQLPGLTQYFHQWR